MKRLPSIAAILAPLLGGALLLLGGCTTTIIPPPAPADPVSVYVTDYGRHSSVLLTDAEGQGTTEYAFGDWDWFALGDKSLGSAARAMFYSHASTLGRRQINAIPRGADPNTVAVLLGAEKVIRFDASAGKVSTLSRQLDDRFDRYRDTVTWNGESSMWFVRYDGDYWGCHNCNHVTAAWLRGLGCEIRGPATLSRFRVRPRDPAPARDAAQ